MVRHSVLEKEGGEQMRKTSEIGPWFYTHSHVHTHTHTHDMHVHTHGYTVAHIQKVKNGLLSELYLTNGSSRMFQKPPLREKRRLGIQPLAPTVFLSKCLPGMW